MLDRGRCWFLAPSIVLALLGCGSDEQGGTLVPRQGAAGSGPDVPVFDVIEHPRSIRHLLGHIEPHVRLIDIIVFHVRMIDLDEIIILNDD